eukprot:scaffold325300_cov66-Tisochrysis_lutea.AAC.6
MHFCSSVFIRRLHRILYSPGVDVWYERKGPSDDERVPQHARTSVDKLCLALGSAEVQILRALNRARENELRLTRRAIEGN